MFYVKQSEFIELNVAEMEYYLSYFRRVDDDLRVQITDNALARDLFPQDYHCLGDNENRPIKWLAIESLLGKTFTTASDVVSITCISIYIYTHKIPE